MCCFPTANLGESTVASPRIVSSTTDNRNWPLTPEVLYADRYRRHSNGTPRFLTTVRSMKVFPSHFINDRQPEIADKAGNTYISGITSYDMQIASKFQGQIRDFRPWRLFDELGKCRQVNETINDGEPERSDYSARRGIFPFPGVDYCGNSLARPVPLSSWPWSKTPDLPLNLDPTSFFLCGPWSFFT